MDYGDFVEFLQEEAEWEKEKGGVVEEKCVRANLHVQAKPVQFYRPSRTLKQGLRWVSVMLRALDESGVNVRAKSQYSSD